MNHTVSFLSATGELTGELPFGREGLLRAYRAVRRVRHFDERAVTLQRQGRLGVYAPYRGQEAAQVGTTLALQSSDWLVPSYRETGAALTHGLPLNIAILYWRAHPGGWNYPAGLRLLPFYIPIASQLTHAVGVAHAAVLQGDDSVVMVYVGDGGSSEGDFHEAMNFAAVYRSPVVFVVQNNGWAISVPTTKQMANQRISDRAAGYGIQGVTVDGNDLVAVSAIARQAVARARAGDGPTLIEAVTYRLAPHTTSDDPGRYRDEGLTAKRAELEPLARLDKLFAERGWWDEAAEADLISELESEFSAALKAADAAAMPDPEMIVEHVFATMTPDQLSAWSSLRRAAAERPVTE